uniref:Uncharacterized protein n=1 Tax=Arundo donax TaxID=35708 RepID=A0A0A9DKN0_ARUDO
MHAEGPGTSSEATRMPLGSVVILVGLRPSRSGRHGESSRPGRGCRSEVYRTAADSAAPESHRAAAAPTPCEWDR